MGHAERRSAITPLGALLRRTRLDELPQIWNVLCGDMSLVGPRPERPEFVSTLTRQIPFYGQRHTVRPGLTGWAQVRYTYGASVEDAMEKLQYDLFYIKNLSMALDLFIIVEDGQDGAAAEGGAMNVARAPRRDVLNAMTIDVEDYFHVSAFDGVVPRSPVGLDSRAASSPTPSGCWTSSTRSSVTRTFFVLGWVAERYPATGARASRAAGTSSPRHGYAHRLVYDHHAGGVPRRHPPREGRSMEQSAAVAVHGYRAPSYSVTPRSLWALDVLIEEGFRYDASIFPIHHDRYGIPLSPRHPYRIDREAGALIEVPGVDGSRGARSTFRSRGGGYFRILPYAWTRWGIARINRDEQRAAIFYLHPWEIDPDQPRLPAGRWPVPPLPQSGQDRSRLRALLNDFRFGPCIAPATGCASSSRRGRRRAGHTCGR